MYLHCHTKGCNWEQDDFFTKSYNLKTKILSDVRWLIKPRMIKGDGYKRFSWWALFLNIKNDIKVYGMMKWKTYEDWIKVKDTAVCPKCGLRNWDID